MDIIFEYLIKALEVVGVAIIVMGVLKMLLVFATCAIRRISPDKFINQIRIELSNYLVLSLEVFIGRDIIETLLNPSINDIIVLVVLVILRTLLAFFLNYEIKHMPQKNIPKELKKKQ
ncbi:DUF1622 domain-containing protein [Candidatus Peregrinibacteria bacterium]|nr:DUF1622 domain-containing protein [Candidatus Peregrinibacteria bacterium]